MDEATDDVWNSVEDRDIQQVPNPQPMVFGTHNLHRFFKVGEMPDDVWNSKEDAKSPQQLLRLGRQRQDPWANSCNIRLNTLAHDDDPWTETQ